jgi:hypothetical protein
MPIRRAIISVSDKTGLVPFAAALSARGVEILSTGATYRALVKAGVPAATVERVDPDMVRTESAQIDLVVVNLRPFEKTTAATAAFREEIIENVDVVRPSMLRNAAKSHARLAVVCDPSDYEAVRAELAATGEVSPALRLNLAVKAFAHACAYDTSISRCLSTLADRAAHSESPQGEPAGGDRDVAAPDSSTDLFARWEREGDELAESARDADLLRDLDFGPPRRTPEQEARRARFVRPVVAMVGLFAAIGVLGAARGLHHKKRAEHASAPPDLLAMAPSMASVTGTPAAAAPASAPETVVGSASATPAERMQLPIVDVEPPPFADPAIQQAWRRAAQALRADDFATADKAFAMLGKSVDVATRETARLARALLWMSKGREADVQPVVEDLAANSITEAVRKRAVGLLHETK